MCIRFFEYEDYLLLLLQLTEIYIQDQPGHLLPNISKIIIWLFLDHVGTFHKLKHFAKVQRSCEGPQGEGQVMLAPFLTVLMRLVIGD